LLSIFPSWQRSQTRSVSSTKLCFSALDIHGTAQLCNCYSSLSQILQRVSLLDSSSLSSIRQWTGHWRMLQSCWSNMCLIRAKRGGKKGFLINWKYLRWRGVVIIVA
jgi:hypothetical protein